MTTAQVTRTGESKQKHNGFAQAMRSITDKQSVDTGMAMTLICLLLCVFTSMTNGFAIAALVTLLVTMTFPGSLKPLAVLWFGFSNRLGKVMSVVLLSIIYAVVIVPIGWLRQKFGKDSMQLKSFEQNIDQNNVSFFHDRKHDFGKDDLLNPY